MKKSLSVILILASQFSFAQNLVNNWSIEDTVSCPTYYGQIFKAVDWNAYRETPDYFNTCNNTVAGVPSNGAGFQYPHSGDAYAGIVTYSTIAINFREIIGTQLTQSLTIGQKYFISFFVCSGYSSLLNISLFSNHIGARFSTVPFSYSYPSPINNIAHLSYSSIITDTINWIKISGAFVADSAYSYLSIGNFFNDSNTSISNLDTNIFNQFAFYYIDDVKVSNDSNFVNTSIENYSINEIEIFPNPARDCITVEGREITSIEVIDIMGNAIIKQNVASSSLKTKVSLGTISQGVYLMRINTKKKSFLKKIIHF